MYCDRCGGVLRADARFCRGCGSAVASEQETAAAIPVPPVEPPAELAAALSGEYEILRLLGRGGMGAVYLARELSLDRLVAVKTLPAGTSSSDPQAVERFLREARLAARLRHPGIVSIHTVGQRNGVTFFTMDFIDGATLETAAGRGAAAERLDRRAAFRSIVAAVDHAHRAGIVHRDLKPSNIMIEPAGHVVVMDFGLAKGEGQEGLTGSGVVVGTPQYMSPEQLEGAPATTRSDVYALGLVGRFLWTGESLVSGESITAVVARHLAGGFDTAVAADERIPTDVRPILAAMVARDPLRRPASAEQVLADLGTPRPAAEGPEASAQSPDEATTVSTPVPGTAGAAAADPPRAFRAQAREKMKGLLDRLEKNRGSG